MPKRNREKLMEQSLYDFLLGLNSTLIAAHKKNTEPCIMTAISGQYVWERDARCETFGKSCEKCLQAWLNDEHPF